MIGRWRPWGHPTGVKAAASWELCPDLQLPEGVASLRCDGATCMAVCEIGKISIGRRRTKCRFKRTKGFFWGRELAPCQGCDPEIAHPVWDVDHVMMGDYLVGRCEVDEKMRKNCRIECPKGSKVSMMNSITLQRKVALKVTATVCKLLKITYVTILYIEIRDWFLESLKVSMSKKPSWWEELCMASKKIISYYRNGQLN